VGEAAEEGDPIPVPASDIGRAGIAEPLEHQWRCLLNRQDFARLQGHQPELPPRLLRIGLEPVLGYALLAQGKRPGIGAKGHLLGSSDLARELIPNQHQG
jgi:hypothetical protein